MSQNIASTLHTLLCNRDHQKECLWYLESQQVECWELEHHKKWISQAEGVVNLSEPTEEQVEELLFQLIKIINSTRTLIWKYHGLEDFISVMIKKTCFKT